MFSTLTEKLILAALALLAAALTCLWLMHVGAKECVAGDKATAATAEVHNAKVEAAGTVADAALESNRAKDAGAPVAPADHVSVQPAPEPPRSCPAAQPRPAPAASPPAVDVRAASEGSGVQPYLSAEWVDAINKHLDAEVQRGHDADVEVRYLQDLLVERDQVCRGQMPANPGPIQ